MYIKRRLENKLVSILKKKNFPPCNPSLDNEYTGDLLNCYGFLWGLNESEVMSLKATAFSCCSNVKNLWELGFSKPEYYNEFSVERAKELFLSDMKRIKIKVKECNLSDEILSDEMKVALFAGKFDFHFVRQNNDGTWAFKEGWKENFTVTDTLPNKFQGYNLVGIYKLDMKNLKKDNSSSLKQKEM